MSTYSCSVEGRLKTWFHTVTLPRGWRFTFGFRLPMPHRGFRPILGAWRDSSSASASQEG